MSHEHEAFLDWLSQWEANLSYIGLEHLLSNPECAALVSQDLLKGFCYEGPLSSPRAAGIVPRVVELFQQAHALGLQHFLLLQDTHETDALEFSAYPPHCIGGTEESETIDELNNLSFSDQFTIFPKNSISSHAGTDLDPWLEAHPEVTTFVNVGVCTDICIYHLAVYFRVRANVLQQRDARIIVPADCVQTYDLSIEAATETGGMPHDGDLLHGIFLYHMVLNGVEVVAGLR
ncbi:MAG: cysteine hydrolase family protein [Thermodesulfobacteriota bacterium]